MDDNRGDPYKGTTSLQSHQQFTGHQAPSWLRWATTNKIFPLREPRISRYPQRVTLNLFIQVLKQPNMSNIPDTIIFINDTWIIYAVIQRTVFTLHSWGNLHPRRHILDLFALPHWLSPRGLFEWRKTLQHKVLRRCWYLTENGRHWRMTEACLRSWQGSGFRSRRAHTSAGFSQSFQLHPN